MEANFRSKQIKPLPKNGKIQDGDTGNHQDIPPTRGMGYLSRLQGCLLPYTNTGTVQEISQIPYSGSDIPVQGSALWPVHSTHEVHCNSKGSKTDGYTQGYKDPPVPRRLVGKSYFLPSLPQRHTNPSQAVPGPGMVGELGEVGAGTKTNL